MTDTALLSTTYFGPVQWYQKLQRYPQVLIEGCESFVKQTYRNRCLIASAQGVLALSVPVVHLAGSTIQDVRISDHGNWRHQHWQAITSAYGDSPFLEYYEDDLRPFFFERRWEFLLDYNEDICRKMCELIDIHPKLTKTSKYEKKADSIAVQACGKAVADLREANNPSAADFREAIRPKHPLPDADFLPRPYYQVFSRQHGFLPNLSILDLLLNMGPESIYYL
jgi:hypothetical protein